MAVASARDLAPRNPGRGLAAFAVAITVQIQQHAPITALDLEAVQGQVGRPRACIRVHRERQKAIYGRYHCKARTRPFTLVNIGITFFTHLINPQGEVKGQMLVGNHW